MKLFQFILCVSVAFIAGGGAGFAGGWLWKSDIVQREQDAREIRIQEFSRILTDSIAATEAWLAASTEKDVATVTKAIEKMKAENVGSENKGWYKDGLAAFEVMLAEAQNGQMPYMIQTRRHINWMQQELAWINAYP